MPHRKYERVRSDHYNIELDKYTRRNTSAEQLADALLMFIVTILGLVILTVTVILLIKYMP